MRVYYFSNMFFIVHTINMTYINVVPVQQQKWFPVELRPYDGKLVYEQ